MSRVILTSILSAVFVGLGIGLLCIAHEYHLIEMQTQIEQIGFYKEDIILLIDNYYKYNWFIAGGVVSLIIGLSIWLNLLG